MDNKTERETIIRLYKEKYTQQEIGEILGCSQQKVSFWLARYKKTGSLTNLPRSGRPTLLKSETLNSLKSQITDLMTERNKSGKSVNSKEIKTIIENRSRKIYSLRHIQRLLNKMGFKRITPRVHHIRHDAAAQEKFKEEFKKNFGKSIWTIS